MTESSRLILWFATHCAAPLVIFWVIIDVTLGLLALKHSKPVVDEPVSENSDGIVIEARNYMEACQIRDGMTVQGSEFKTVTRAPRLGKNKWIIGKQEYRT